MAIFCSDNSGFYDGISSTVVLVVQKQLCVHNAHKVAEGCVITPWILMDNNAAVTM